MRFEPVQTEKKGAKVASQIARMISDGVFEKGDKLPPERRVAEEMEVSRHAVREALSALQIVGIIESRAGDGTYVKRSVHASSVEEARQILIQDDDPFEVVETRQLFESALAEAVVERASSNILCRMNDMLGEMEAASDEEDLERFVRADQDFHLAFAEATGNSVIRRSVHDLLDSMNQQLWREMKREYLFLRNPERSIQIHRDILDAMRTEDPEAVRRSVVNHYETVKTHLEQE